MNEYILIMTLIIFQSIGNTTQMETATFNSQVSCLEGGFKWSENIENSITSPHKPSPFSSSKISTRQIKATFVCARK